MPTINNFKEYSRSRHQKLTTFKDNTKSEERLIRKEQSQTATCIRFVSWANSIKAYFIFQNANACT